MKGDGDEKPTWTGTALPKVGPARAQGRAGSRRLPPHVWLAILVAGGLLAVRAATGSWPGTIVVAARVVAGPDCRTVRHERGGVVLSILVRDGDPVYAGQPLVVIGDLRNDAGTGRLLDQLDEERIRNARATAEAAFAAGFDPPAGLGGSTRTADRLAREAALFAVHKRSLDERVASLSARVRDERARAAALEEPIVAGGQRLAGDRADLARTQQRAQAFQDRIARARIRYQRVATDEADASAAKVRELEDRLRSRRDQATPREVRAPADGRVTRLRVASIGTITQPGAPLLDIESTRERFLVEAQIHPRDVGRVHEGAIAEVRFPTVAAPGRSPIAGKVAGVATRRDASPGSDASRYVVTVEIDAAALAQRPDITPRTGMPAELLITTPGHTFFRILAMPFDALARTAMRDP